MTTHSIDKVQQWNEGNWLGYVMDSSPTRSQSFSHSVGNMLVTRSWSMSVLNMVAP